MQPEKMQLTQDGQPQFRTQRVEKAFIALSLIMPEGEAILHEAAEKKQSTIMLQGCLLGTATQLLQKQQKNTARQILIIDTPIH